MEVRDSLKDRTIDEHSRSCTRKGLALDTIIRRTNATDSLESSGVVITEVHVLIQYSMVILADLIEVSAFVKVAGSRASR